MMSQYAVVMQSERVVIVVTERQKTMSATRRQREATFTGKVEWRAKAQVPGSE